jgi:serine-type D-Ala-D-Ala carboxypeptidase/endopeptidase
VRRFYFTAIVLAALAAGCGGRAAIPAFGTNAQQVSQNARIAPSVSDARAVAAAVNAAVAAIPSPAPPGMAFVVFYHGQNYYFYRGVLRIGGPSVDGSTIFELGSLTKSFTGIMLGAAVNQRIHGVTLADLPGPWMAISGPPNATAPRPEGGITCPIPTATPVSPSDYGTFASMTLLELGTHTSGLPDLPPGPQGTHVGRQCFSPQQFVNFIETGKFRKPPAAYRYSNIGFGTVGYILQGIYGKGSKTVPSWYSLARKQIIDPLGMTSTFDLNVPKKYQAVYARGYLYRNKAFVSQLHWEWDPWPAAGTLRSTAPDMAKYLKLVLGLAGPTVMRQGAVTAERQYVRIAPGQQVGLAWQTTALFTPPPSSPQSPAVTWKNGGTNGFSTWLGFLRPPLVKKPMGIVVLLSQGNAKFDGPTARAILTKLYLRDINAR